MPRRAGKVIIEQYVVDQKRKVKNPFVFYLYSIVAGTSPDQHLENKSESFNGQTLNRSLGSFPKALEVELEVKTVGSTLPLRLFESHSCGLFVAASKCTLPSVGAVRWGFFCREQFHQSFSRKLHMLAV